MKETGVWRVLEKSWKKGLVLCVILFLVGYIVCGGGTYHRNEGTVFGTTYHIVYESNDDLHDGIMQELKKVDGALSMFNDTSQLARINRNEAVEPDEMFLTVFTRAMEISGLTDGAFDVTVAPLVNAWGFGFEKSQEMTSYKVDSLLQFVGYRNVKLQAGKIVKKTPLLRMDFSAIAKGYGVDVVARFLEREGVRNYMVEIGGEVNVKGKAPLRKDSKDRLWKIGINKPFEDSLSTGQSLQAVLKLTDCGMATSGNYRNFYYKEGKRYAHTIDPHTGYPVQHTLLSATVLAPDCMTADAYATAFMVMGLEKAIRFVKNRSELDAYFLYSDSTGRLKEWVSEPMKEKLLR